jgi:23S rRNA pseudouridine1911/1915/1917 synthase
MEETKKVAKNETGIRLDVFLERCFGVTRSQAKKWISAKCVQRDGETATKAGEKVKAGQIIRVSVPDEHPVEASSEPIDILLETDDVVVVNKPAGIATHPDETYRTDTLVQRVLSRSQLSSIGAPERPGVVHRLDKDTSGVIVFAKNNAAHLSLTESFSKRKVEKIYLALVHGTGLPNSGTIDSPIMRDAGERKKMTVSDSKNAKHAVSHFEGVERFMNTIFVRVKIETGRTHQIRVHFSAIGHPLVGDKTYGNKKLDEAFQKKYGILPRLFLHAEKLSFPDPKTKKQIECRVDIAEDLEECLKNIRNIC